MWDSLGKTEEFFFTKDRDAAATTTMYMKIKQLVVDHIQGEALYRARFVLESLR
jgi:hypothetical protein